MIAESPERRPYGLQPDGTVIHYPLAYEEIYRRGRERAKNVEEYDHAWEKIFGSPMGQYRPLPAALKFHKSPAQFRVMVGGNRSSKSFALAREVFFYATGLHPWRKVEVPNVIWHATVTHELVGSVLWRNIMDLISTYDDGLDYRVWWRNRGRRIPAQLDLRVRDKDDRPATSSIVFKSYEEGPRPFQGTQRRLIAFDEQFDETIWLECVSRIGAGQPLDIAMAFTPIYSQPWLEEKLRTPAENWDVVEMPLDDNRISRGGFIEDGAIDTLIEEWPEEVQPTRRLGQWGSFLGAVYKGFDRGLHVIPASRDLEFLPPARMQELDTVGSIDWGGANPFVFLWVCKLPHKDGAVYVFDEYYHDPRHGQRLIKDHAKEILRRTREKWGTRLARVWSDHDATDRFEMAACGVTSYNAKKDVSTGIECVRTLLKAHDYGAGKVAHLYVAERCPNLIREIATYHYAGSTKTRNPKDEPVKMNDHCVDALRYACLSEKIAGPVQAAPRPDLGVENRRVFV